jgi:hypothetical protein
MKRLMLEHAFQTVDSVIFVIGPKNIRSQRAVAKLGAVLTPDEPPRDGDTDRVVFRLTKAAYRDKQATA